jgi:hypothetical protein
MNYIVSTIQYNAVVNRSLLKNMLAFADNNKVSKIYLFVMPGKTVDEESISNVLYKDDRIESPVRLTPLQGLTRNSIESLATYSPHQRLGIFLFLTQV